MTKKFHLMHNIGTFLEGKHLAGVLFTCHSCVVHPSGVQHVVTPVIVPTTLFQWQISFYLYSLGL